MVSDEQRVRDLAGKLKGKTNFMAWAHSFRVALDAIDLTY